MEETLSIESFRAAIINNQERCFQLLNDCSEKEFNTKRSDGGWSPAQILQHLVKANAGTVLCLQGEKTDADRDPFEKVGIIDTIFLNFESKLKAPQDIVPDENSQSQEELLSAYAQINESVIAAAGKTDLSKICSDFPFPTLGNFTGFEWLRFMDDHDKRHLHQLENVLIEIKKKNG